MAIGGAEQGSGRRMGDHDSNGALEEREGRYANRFRIGSNAHEFLLDFGQSASDENNDERYHTRIITVPMLAKRLRDLLSESLSVYESNYGEIVESDAQRENGNPRAAGPGPDSGLDPCEQ